MPHFTFNLLCLLSCQCRIYISTIVSIIRLYYTPNIFLWYKYFYDGSNTDRSRNERHRSIRNAQNDQFIYIRKNTLLCVTQMHEIFHEISLTLTREKEREREREREEKKRRKARRMQGKRSGSTNMQPVHGCVKHELHPFPHKLNP